MFFKYSEMRSITTRTIQTIARTTDEKKYQNSADESENQLRKSNHDGQDNITASGNHPHFEASVTKQNETKQGIKEDIKAWNKQSDHDGDNTKDSNGKDEGGEWFISIAKTQLNVMISLFFFFVSFILFNICFDDDTIDLLDLIFNQLI